MNRSTKRVVGWGTGVAVAVCLVLLTFILIIVTSGTPKTGTDSDDVLKLDLVKATGPATELEAAH